ncbi:YheC/YheD family protein [Paenibacillus sp. GSMTC-2017]|uniref:YheC/YheD family endospore coat-associated protein n=1 Tax=Paenibacillus sp. GSMTC-2017 TaxID=2794350 RepID=UPI0018D6EE7C|nr:YheC/YheD family protein [Paenibacillus sp. GSMTC-2017]MBH5317254.1 YheC/YheD family protein [Paenibacillus sp. GSMTC-2017]
MTQPILGILTLYLNDAGLLEEKDIYERMTIEGKRLGIQVLVFTPQDVNYNNNRILALFYNPEAGTWKKKWTPLPELIFDRCRIQKSHRYDQLLKFRAKYNHLNFLNRPLRNKWAIHSILSKDAKLASFLPKTRYIEKVQDVHDMLRVHSLLYLKPVNGTGGRGIFRIERVRDGTLLIQGRDQSRHIIKPQRMSSNRLNDYLNGWDLKENRYIAQQGIQLKLPNGRVHDFRLLVQKDGSGKWRVTGCAGRVGAPESITANLHGGGRAVKMDQLLREWINDEQKISSIKADVDSFGVNVATYLELCYDALCELAIDIAIDRNGRIWMIEVNPKPAREVFKRAGENDVYRTAIARPLEYALWKYKQSGKSDKTFVSNKIATKKDD